MAGAPKQGWFESNEAYVGRMDGYCRRRAQEQRQYLGVKELRQEDKIDDMREKIRDLIAQGKRDQARVYAPLLLSRQQQLRSLLQAKVACERLENRLGERRLQHSMETAVTAFSELAATLEKSRAEDMGVVLSRFELSMEESKSSMGAMAETLGDVSGADDDGDQFTAQEIDDVLRDLDPRPVEAKARECPKEEEEQQPIPEAAATALIDADLAQRIARLGK